MHNSTADTLLATLFSPSCERCTRATATVRVNGVLRFCDPCLYRLNDHIRGPIFNERETEAERGRPVGVKRRGRPAGTS